MSDTQHQRRSAWPLIVGFAVLAVLIAAAGYWAWRQQSASMQRQAERSLAAIGELKAGQITAWMGEREGDAETVRGNPLVSAAVADRLAGRDLGAASNLQTWLDNRQRNNDYRDVVLTSPKGAVLLRSPSTASDPLSAATKALVAKAAATGRVESSELYQDADGNALLDLVAPISAADGGVIATAILRSDLDSVLYPLIQDWPLPSKSGETLLVERRGDRVVYLNELRHRKNTALKLTVPLSKTDVPAVMAVRGRRGVVQGVDYRGVPVLSAVQPVPGTPWFIVAKEDTAEVLGAIRTRGWLTAGFALLLVGLAGVGALFLWRSREARASTEILESEGKFRTLFENMTEGVALHELVVDAGGAPLDYRILDLNPAYEAQTGVSAAQVRGKLSGDAYGTAEPPFLAEYAHTAQTGEPRRFETCFEPLARHFDITVVAQGEGRFATVFEDITERKQSEEDLRESEAKFRTLLENLPAGVVVHAPDTTILLSNPLASELLGLTAGQMRGKAAMDPEWRFLGEDGGALPLEDYPVNQVLSAGRALSSLFIGVRRPGHAEPVWLLCNAYPVRDASGELLQVVVTFIDVTERKQAEDEIRRLNAELEQRVLDRTAQLDAANKELEAFAYSVSHDLRAPLRHISGFSELLAARSADVLDDRGRHYLETITTSVREMGVLIDDLLQFSRTGRTALQIAEVDMEAALREALEPLRRETEGRDIEWTIGALPRVVGDHALLRQVWANLLSNAAKYSRGRTPARIEVGVRNGDGEREDVFYVRDNGVGFDMQYAHKLFGVFQRLHSAAEFEGTGIGLANVQRIIDRLGGRVWAEAELDQGAVFCFSLPRRKETPS